MDLPKNTENVTISMPSWLIEVVDEYCEQNDYSRSRLITRAVRKYLLLKMDGRDVWHHLYRDRFGKS